MSVILQIADAVVAQLNAASLSQPVVAQRHYQPVFELREMKDLKVTVVPRGVTLVLAGRAVDLDEFQVDVGVQKKVASVEAAHLDPLIALVAEMAQLFRGKRLNALPGAIWTKSVIDPLYAPEHLELYRQFTSVLTLSFKVGS